MDKSFYKYILRHGFFYLNGHLIVMPNYSQTPRNNIRVCVSPGNNRCSIQNQNHRSDHYPCIYNREQPIGPAMTFHPIWQHCAFPLYQSWIQRWMTWWSLSRASYWQGWYLERLKDINQWVKSLVDERVNEKIIENDYSMKVIFHLW